MSDNDLFLDAVKQGDLPRVEHFLSANRDLARAVDSRGVSALLLALYGGHRGAAESIRARRPHLSMGEAAAFGALDEIREILRISPESANGTGPDGFSPLGLAAYFGHTDAVRLLLGAGAKPSAPSANAMQVTPLHSACAQADADCAVTISVFLLAAGADPNARQHGGWTPLHAAAARGNLPLGEALVRAGAEPSPVSDEGKTPIQLAREGGHQRFAEWLRGVVLGSTTSP